MSLVALVHPAASDRIVGDHWQWGIGGAHPLSPMIPIGIITPGPPALSTGA